MLTRDQAIGMLYGNMGSNFDRELNPIGFLRDVLRQIEPDGSLCYVADFVLHHRNNLYMPPSQLLRLLRELELIEPLARTRDAKIVLTGLGEHVSDVLHDGSGLVEIMYGDVCIKRFSGDSIVYTPEYTIDTDGAGGPYCVYRYVRSRNNVERYGKYKSSTRRVIWLYAVLLTAIDAPTELTDIDDDAEGDR